MSLNKNAKDFALVIIYIAQLIYLFFAFLSISIGLQRSFLRIYARMQARVMIYYYIFSFLFFSTTELCNCEAKKI